MTVGTDERVRLLPERVEVTMDDVLLQEEEGRCEVLLGCNMQANLKWKKQILELINKLRKRLTALSKIRSVCQYPVKKLVAEGTFNSVLVYCLPLF